MTNPSRYIALEMNVEAGGKSACSHHLHSGHHYERAPEIVVCKLLFGHMRLFHGPVSENIICKAEFYQDDEQYEPVDVFPAEFDQPGPEQIELLLDTNGPGLRCAQNLGPGHGQEKAVEQEHPPEMFSEVCSLKDDQIAVEDRKIE